MYQTKKHKTEYGRTILTILVFILAALVYRRMIVLINQVDDQTISLLANITSGISISIGATILITLINE